jgi:hypothetical protein
MSDILSDEERAALAVGPDDEPNPETNDQQQQTEEQRQAEERARDEKGRFVAKEGEEPTKEAEQTDDKPKGDGKVPQGALHAERERRKAAEARAEEAQKALNQIAEMRAKLNGAPQQEQQQPGEENEVEQLRRQIEELKQGQTKTTNYLQSQQLDAAEHAQLVTALQQSEDVFRKDHPDYDAAIEHVVMARANELRLYGLNDMEIGQTIREEIADISRAAIAQKRDPAEVGYEIARLRGYTPKQADPIADPKPNGGGKAQDIVSAIQKAQAQGKSLGQAAGGATAQTINAETIARMSQSEFDALYATDEGRALIDSL